MPLRKRETEPKQPVQGHRASVCSRVCASSKKPVGEAIPGRGGRRIGVAEGSPPQSQDLHLTERKLQEKQDHCFPVLPTTNYGDSQSLSNPKSLCVCNRRTVLSYLGTNIYRWLVWTNKTPDPQKTQTNLFYCL